MCWPSSLPSAATQRLETVGSMVMRSRDENVEFERGAAVESSHPLPEVDITLGGRILLLRWGIEEYPITPIETAYTLQGTEGRSTATRTLTTSTARTATICNSVLFQRQSIQNDHFHHCFGNLCNRLQLVPQRNKQLINLSHTPHTTPTAGIHVATTFPATFGATTAGCGYCGIRGGERVKCCTLRDTSDERR